MEYCTYLLYQLEKGTHEVMPPGRGCHRPDSACIENPSNRVLLPQEAALFDFHTLPGPHLVPMSWILCVGNGGEARQVGLSGILSVVTLGLTFQCGRQEISHGESSTISRRKERRLGCSITRETLM